MSNTDDSAPNGGNDDGTRLRTVTPAKAAGEATKIKPLYPIRSPHTDQLAANPTRIRDIAQTPAYSSPQTIHDQATFEPGKIIKDRFLLESLLGRGGMGIVFAAIDKRKEEARDPNPHIAIKILNADFRSHPDALVALQREARKAQSLAHPNVVTVFDFDRDNASVYMTMERLRGRSLDAVVREARGRGIEREPALKIIRGIAEGLAYAHRKGIVHSDLKPANVFVLEDGTPKILDFGIARAVPVAGIKEQDSFDAGSLGAYTEAYATQEMVDGADPHPADDVYALGLITYELLTGTHPYKRQSAAQAHAQRMHATAPKSLKRREWRVLQSTLAFDRDARPVDAGEFLKRFFGVTPLQKSVLAALVALVLLSGFLWYRSYQAAGPAIELAKLPVETRQQFLSLMADGDREWQFYRKDHNLVVLFDAVDRYDEAYKLHPRDRDAIRALERSADEFLEHTKGQPELQREAAKNLADKSEYLAKYAPIMNIIQSTAP